MSNVSDDSEGITFFIGAVCASAAVGNMYDAATGWLTFGILLMFAAFAGSVVNTIGRIVKWSYEDE